MTSDMCLHWAPSAHREGCSHPLLLPQVKRRNGIVRTPWGHLLQRVSKHARDRGLKSGHRGISRVASLPHFWVQCTWLKSRSAVFPPENARKSVEVLSGILEPRARPLKVGRYLNAARKSHWKSIGLWLLNAEAASEKQDSDPFENLTQLTCSRQAEATCDRKESSSLSLFPDVTTNGI